MTKGRLMGIGVAVLVVAAGAWLWRRGGMARPEMETRAGVPAVKAGQKERRAGNMDTAGTAPPVAKGAASLSAAEKAERVERIKRDYDEVRAKVAADYTAAGANFPGGLNAFLRQLALLEREKRADFATFLTRQELEDLEYRETTAGQTTQRLLSGAEFSDEQRRAAFRLQLAFEDGYALIFDLSPQALFERETMRQQTQQRIRAAIGEEAFVAWLRGEGGDFDKFTKFVAEQGQLRARAFELWELKNEFIRKRLELGAQKLPPEQARLLQGSLTREMQARVVGILGPGAAEIAQREVLGWLPAK